jgi:hypothetical protein
MSGRAGNRAPIPAVSAGIMRWIAAGSLLLLVACGSDGGTSPSSSSTYPPQGSGVTGRVTIGPSCPVVVAGSPCPDRPWRGVVRAIGPGGATVGEGSADERGVFSIPLPPGSYQLVALPVTGPPTGAKPVDVTVPPAGYAHVAIRLDSGIR